MRFVTTGAIFHHIMLERGLFQKVVMAIPAQSRRGFFHQRFLVGCVRIVTRQTVTVANRLVDILRFLGRYVIVAFCTSFLYRLLQQPLDFTRVRRVAFQTVAVASWLMDKFLLADDVVMAISAHVLDRFFQQPLEIGRMR